MNLLIGAKRMPLFITPKIGGGGGRAEKSLTRNSRHYTLLLWDISYER